MNCPKCGSNQMQQIGLQGGFGRELECQGCGMQWYCGVGIVRPKTSKISDNTQLGGGKDEI